MSASLVEKPQPKTIDPKPVPSGAPGGRAISGCRICGSHRLELALDLGKQPWCNHFLRPGEAGTEPRYPLRLVHCAECKTAQLDYTVPKEVLFGDHTYLSGITRTLSDHFASIAREADARFCAGRADKSALDIGSNDGTQLRHFMKLGYDVLGVESSKGTARLANEAGVPTLNAFFNEGTAREMNRKFDLINAAGVFFHLEELHSVTEGIRQCLRDDGVFVVQFLYMRRIVDNTAFDQIYHEHLLYYNLQTVESLLRRHGMALFDAWLSPIHGGSIIAFATHAKRAERSSRLAAMMKDEDDAAINELRTYRAFSREVERSRETNLSYLRTARDSGRRVFGFGAPVKGNTLLNYFGVGSDLIECLVEKNALRRGLVSPGMHIPVVIEGEFSDIPDIYYVLAWNFREEILKNNAHLLERGVEFYFPVNPGR